MPTLTKEQKFIRRVPYFENPLLKPTLSMILYQEAVEANKGTLKSSKQCTKCGNWEPKENDMPGHCKLYSTECISSLWRPKFVKKEANARK